MVHDSHTTVAPYLLHMLMHPATLIYTVLLDTVRRASYRSNFHMWSSMHFFLWHGLAPAQCVGRPDPAPTATHLPAASAAGQGQGVYTVWGWQHQHAQICTQTNSWQKRRKEATQWGPRIFAMSSMRRERTSSHLSMFPLWDMKSIHASRRSVADPLNFLAMNEDSRACGVHEITHANTYTQTHTCAHKAYSAKPNVDGHTHICKGLIYLCCTQATPGNPILRLALVREPLPLFQVARAVRSQQLFAGPLLLRFHFVLDVDMHLRKHTAKFGIWR